MCDARENCEQLFVTVAGTLGELYEVFKFCMWAIVGIMGSLYG